MLLLKILQLLLAVCKPELIEISQWNEMLLTRKLNGGYVYFKVLYLQAELLKS